MHAVISGDVVAFTRLSIQQRAFLEERVSDLLRQLKRSFGVYGQLVRGDFLELYLPKPADGLRVMLLVKSYVRSQELPEADSADKLVKLHLEHGIRLALAIGELERVDPERGVLDGPAVYMTGRLLNEEKTHDKQRVAIKRTLFFRSTNPEFEAELGLVVTLLDELLKRATRKQCEVLYHRLCGLDEKQISAILERGQSTINKHTTQVGWHAVEQAVERFETAVSKNI